MSSTQHDASDQDGSNVVRDGERVHVPFALRDSARQVGSPWALAGRTLRCTDTGRLTAIDPAMAAAIDSEAAKARLPVGAYLRDRLHFALEGN